MKLNSASVKPGTARICTGHDHNSISLELVLSTLALWRQAGDRHAIVTKGQSMLPLIADGDSLIVSLDTSTIRRGSIILFYQESRLIAHRVLEILVGTPIRYQTKGDNAKRLDPPITHDQILGYVLAVQRADYVLWLDNRMWRVIGGLFATVTLAATSLSVKLRRMPKGRKGLVPLLQARVVKSCGLAVLAIVVKIVIYLGRSQR